MLVIIPLASLFFGGAVVAQFAEAAARQPMIAACRDQQHDTVALILYRIRCNCHYHVFGLVGRTSNEPEHRIMYLKLHVYLYCFFFFLGGGGGGAIVVTRNIASSNHDRRRYFWSQRMQGRGSLPTLCCSQSHKWCLLHFGLVAAAVSADGYTFERQMCAIVLTVACHVLILSVIGFGGASA